MNLRQHWHIGTMGWGYDDWRDAFYPRSLKPGEYLSFYARHFKTVEIDSTFHAVPSPERFERWAAAVPASFRFCVKTPRAITHDGVVAKAAEPMKAFVSAASRLREKLAVILIQYPPTLPGRVWPQVERFLATLPEGYRYAVEFRHAGFAHDTVYAGLERLGIALVNAEYDRDPLPPIVTADFAYVRLIGLHDRYDPTDHERIDPTDRLLRWHRAIESTRARDVWCIISNDYAGFSIATSDRMRAIVGQSVTSRQERLGTLF